MESIEELKKNQANFEKVMKECQDLRWKKLQDYGICYNDFGITGIAIKLNDKNSRIVNLITKHKEPNNESIRDSAVDLINYAVMLIMELDNEKQQ